MRLAHDQIESGWFGVPRQIKIILRGLLVDVERSALTRIDEKRCVAGLYVPKRIDHRARGISNPDVGYLRRMQEETVDPP